MAIDRGTRLSVVLWLRLAQTCGQIERGLLEQLREWDLSLAQFDVLVTVGLGEGLTQQELAGELKVTKGNVCQLLDRMEQRGLLARRQEGRSNRLYLTDAGRALFLKVVPAHETRLGEIFAGLSSDEQFQLLHLVRKLERSLRA